MISFFLTAGFATRFRPQSNVVPKPMMPFLGIPILAFTNEIASSFTGNTSILNLHHLAEEQRKGALQVLKNKNLIFLHETPNILGSGGALLNAHQYLKGDFLLANGDEAFFPKNDDYKNFYKQHQENKNFVSLLTCDHPEAGKKFGAIWVDDDDNIVDIGKNSPNESAKPKHFLGFSILHSSICDNEEVRDCNILYDLVLKHIGKKKIKTFSIDCDWFELGNPKDFLAAQNSIAKNWDYYKEHEMIQTLFSRYHKADEITHNAGNMLINKSSTTVKQFSGFSYIAPEVKKMDIDSIKSSILLSTASSNHYSDEIIV